jgi:hypothetical protein
MLKKKEQLVMTI